MEPNCIICMSDNGYIIMGPFTSQDALGAAGEKWQADNGDDPRWQSLYLADPHAKPIVIPPV